MEREQLVAVTYFEGAAPLWQPAAAALFDAWAEYLVTRAQKLRFVSMSTASSRGRDWRFEGSPRVSAPRSWSALLRQLGTHHTMSGGTDIFAPYVESGQLRVERDNLWGDPASLGAQVVLALDLPLLDGSQPAKEVALLTALLDEAVQSPCATHARLEYPFAPERYHALRAPFQDRWCQPFRGGPWLRGLGMHVWLAPGMRARADEVRLAQVAKLEKRGAALRITPKGGLSAVEVARAFTPLLSAEGLAQLA